jgi:Short C-terminal domain/Phospholipase_D-nuclease N-terminal
MQLLAADYPLLDVVLSIIVFFALAILFFALVAVVLDIFRSRDLSGWSKAGWFVLVLLVPLVGLIVYLVVRGPKMQSHAEAQMEKLGMAPPSPADELTKLAALRERGAITDGEYEKQKAVLLR